MSSASSISEIPETLLPEAASLLPPETFEQFTQNVTAFKNQVAIEKQKLLQQNIPENKTETQAVLNAKQYFNTLDENPVDMNYLDDLQNYIYSGTIPEYVTKKGHGLIKFLSDDPIELLKRLEILFTAKHHGHNSVFNEINAILKRLLEKKIITKDIYKKLTSNQRRA